jgi:SdpC family antimicrobial peptide
MSQFDNKLTKCTAVVMVAAMMLATGAVAANATEPLDRDIPAAESMPAKPVASEEPTTTYSDEEIVGLFVFGAGRAANEHPEIVSEYVRAPFPSVSREVIGDLTAQLRGANPRFHEEVTVPLQSGDPERILDAQAAFTDALKSITRAAPEVGDSQGVGRSLVFVAAAAVGVIVVAVAGAAVVQTTVAVNVNWAWAYTQPGDASDFARQVKAADIASKL